MVQGRLPGNPNASWLAGGRRTYYDLVVERFAKGDLPGFQDFQLGLRWPWGERSSLVLRGQRARETAGNLDYLDPELDAASDRFDHRSLDERWSATLELGLGERLGSTTTLSAYRNPQDSFHDTGFGLPGPSVLQYQRRIRIEDVALRQSFALAQSERRRFEAGFELHRLRTSWSMHGGGDLPGFWLFRGPSLALNPWGSRGDTLEWADLEGTRETTRWGTWLQGDLALAPGLSVQPGLRLERSTINGDMRLLPRLGAMWRPSASTRVFAGLGWFAQSPGFEKTILSDTFLDFGGAAPLPLRSESARQLTLGIERDLGAGLVARAELYHKRFDDLIVGRLETEEDRQRRLSSYVIPPDFPGGPPLDPLITTTPVNDGWGTARGLELSLMRRASGTAPGLSGLLTYTYGVANRHSYGLTYPFDYDRRHAVTLALDWRVSRTLSFSAAWRGASGLPYTPAQPAVSFGLEQRGDEPPMRVADRFYRPPAGAPDDFVYTAGPGRLEDMNSARHPFYSRLDVRARFQPGGPSGRWEVYLDVYNALKSDLMSRQNSPAFEPSVAWDGTRWRVGHSDVRRFVLPSFGLRFRF
jgi:outer membrane receptor for ferrienterochelin and colicin